MSKNTNLNSVKMEKNFISRLNSFFPIKTTSIITAYLSGLLTAAIIILVFWFMSSREDNFRTIVYDVFCKPILDPST